MKRTIPFIMTILLILSLAGCVKVQPAEPSTTPSPTASPAASPSSIPTTPVPTEAKTPIITDGPIPELLGNQWYDWDRVGRYPGSSVVECGDKICLNMIGYDTSGKTDTDYYYLSFANADGSGYKKTKLLYTGSRNYKDEWVYMIYSRGDKDGIYKVKTNGNGLQKLYEARSTGAKKLVCIDDLLLIDDKLYFIEEDASREMCSIKCIDLYGGSLEILDETPSCYYGTSLYYHNGNLYYMAEGLNAQQYDIFQYNTDTGDITMTAENIDMDISRYVIAGDKLFHTIPTGTNENALYVHSLSTGRDEQLIHADIGYIHDFSLFDRWLLIYCDKGLMGYDLPTGKLYLLNNVPWAKDMEGCTLLIESTPKCVYLEFDKWGYLYPIIFANGKVNVYEQEINEIHK